VISLLVNKIDYRSGQDVFIDLVKSLKTGTFTRRGVIDYKTRDLSEKSARVECKHALSRALEKLQLLGLIEQVQGTGDRLTITALGRRVYNRLVLERRSSPPS
jgi:hypothetical protein